MSIINKRTRPVPTSILAVSEPSNTKPAKDC